MKKTVRTSFGMGLVSPTLVLGLIAASFFTAYSQAVTAAPPDVSVGYCAPDSPAQDLTLFVGDLNVGVPLPSRYSNGTSQPVTFTTTMKTNRFFGSERVVDRRTVGPGLDQIVFHLFIGVNETTPLGTDTVVIEVTSNATGATVLGRCTFNLTVTRRAEQRDVIGIPLRPCFLEATDLALPGTPGQVVPPKDVIRLIDQINDQTWLKHARIAFRAAVSAGVPVIKDPVTRPLSFGGPPTKPGEVEVPRDASRPGEHALIKTACEEKWPTQKGIPIVFVRRFLEGGGTLGFAAIAEDELIQNKARLPANSSTRLCQQPRQLRLPDDLQVGDVTRVGWALLLEPTSLVNTPAKTVNTLAHELGHTLLLGHGNGLDDDRNGKLPPEPGPRRFDLYCDTMGPNPENVEIPLEDKLTPSVSCETTESLMRFDGFRNSCFILRPLQIEQARAAAKLVPGASFDMAADPAGALVADIPSPPPPEIPLDILIANTELAETPGSGITEVSQTVLGALPSDANNRYSTFLDLDNNPSSGCNPATLGLPTSFTGAEAVTSVTLEVAGGAAPQLAANVWSCGGREFIPLSDPEISADASDVELQDIRGPSGKSLARISVTLPTSLLGPRADRVRVQAVAEQLHPGGKLDRLPQGEGEGGVIILTAPDLPQCSVSAPVVNPGSVTRVQASGFPPDAPAEVQIGGDLVASGSTDSEGTLDIEMGIPSQSGVGPSPVTVLVSDTLFTATCQIEVTGGAVTPVTTAEVFPPPNDAGWNNADVMVTLTASSIGAEVGSVTFSASGAQTIPMTTVAGGSAQISISAEGETTLTYFATDSSGRIEPAAQLVVRIDFTPPSISGEQTPSPNTAGWNSSDVTVNFQCEDVTSGVASCSDSVLLTAEGANQSVTGTAIDRAGNTISTTVDGINLDKTPPTMACSVSPERLWPPNHKLVAVTASVAVEDSLSGGAGFILTSVTSNEPDTGLGHGDRPNDIQGFDIGTPDTSGQLRAERSGRGNRRVYTLTYRDMDVARNTAMCVTKVKVPHDQRAIRVTCAGQSPTMGCTVNGMPNQLCQGTEDKDTIDGTSGPDVINGLGGNDDIMGFASKDIICGGDGRDTIDGGKADDRLFGQSGNDTLRGMMGEDTINGGSGNDVMFGGSGNDTLRGMMGEDTINGGDDNDKLFGGADNDTLRGGNGDDSLDGVDGNDDFCNGGDDVNGDTATMRCETVVNVP